VVVVVWVVVLSPYGVVVVVVFDEAAGGTTTLTLRGGGEPSPLLELQAARASTASMRPAGRIFLRVIVGSFFVAVCLTSEFKV
jgi:hypothetical protein